MLLRFVVAGMLPYRLAFQSSELARLLQLDDCPFTTWLQLRELVLGVQFQRASWAASMPTRAIMWRARSLHKLVIGTGIRAQSEVKTRFCVAGV